MQALLQAVILGVLTGGLYALMASGLTLVFGIMRVINVAQGAFVILAAYLSYSLFGHLGLDPFLSILLLMPAMFVAGVLTQLVFVRSLRGEHASEMSLLVTWALALGIEGLLSIVYKTTVRSTNTGYANRSWTLGSYQFSEPRVYGFAASVVILARALRAAPLLALRPLDPRGRPEPGLGAAARREREARLRVRVRDRRRDRRRGRRPLRDRLPVQPG